MTPASPGAPIPAWKSTQSDEKMAPGRRQQEPARAGKPRPGQKSKTLSSESNETGKAGKGHEGPKAAAATTKRRGPPKGGLTRISMRTFQVFSGQQVRGRQQVHDHHGTGRRPEQNSPATQRTKISTVIKQQNIQTGNQHQLLGFGSGPGCRAPVGFPPPADGNHLDLPGLGADMRCSSSADSAGRGEFRAHSRSWPSSTS